MSAALRINGKNSKNKGAKNHAGGGVKMVLQKKENEKKKNLSGKALIEGEARTMAPGFHQTWRGKTKKKKRSRERGI